MKKHLLLLFALASIVSSALATTYENVQIGDLYYNLFQYDYWNGYQNRDTIYAQVTYNPNKYSGSIVVPDTVEYNEQKYAVKEIGGSAFHNCSNLTSVELPIGVEQINSSAFENCGSLLSINIPEGVKRIEYNAFHGCGNLSSIVFPSSLTHIGTWAFRECEKLTSIVIPNNVTTIEVGAFEMCKKIRSLTIGNSVQSIGDYAFNVCDSLRCINIPSLSIWCKITFGGVSANPCYYGHHLYLNGKEITELVIPEDITAIGQNAFYGCTEIKSVVIPNNVQSIETNAFGACRGLKSVSLGTNIVNLNKDAFNGCSNLSAVEWNITNFIDIASENLSPFYDFRNQLTSFTFGENVEHIPAYLCYEMSNLSRIDIPASVTSVGEGAFAYCSKLTEINAAEGSPIYSSVDGVLFNKDTTSLIIYPAGKSASSYTIPNIVQTIEENAFYGSVNLASVTIPASVTTIEAGNEVIPMWSFAGNTPATIAENAFAEDVYLIVDNTDTYKAAWPEYASRIFPQQYAVQSVNVTALPDRSALHMTIGEENLINVINLTISGTINSYDLMLMRNKMINLRELDLTNASIEANAYEYYTGYCSHADTLLNHSFRNLRSIKLPRTLKLAEETLLDCPDIKYAEFNGGVVGDRVAPYEGDGDLTVVLNEGVTEIKPYAFASSNIQYKYFDSNYNGHNTNNTKLRAISLPNSLESVEAKRFWFCRNLQEVVLGDSITTISNYAFSECPKLTNIELPDSLTMIGDFAFQGSGLVEISIPNMVQNIGAGAFLSALSSEMISDWPYIIITSNFILMGTNRQMVYCYNSNSDLIGWNLCVQDYLMVSPFRVSTSSSLKKLSFAPNSKLKEINMFAFGYSQIDSISMPDSVATIGQFAFVGNQNLRYVHFGENSALRVIDEGVFQNCGALKQFTLPAHLTQIKELAFSLHTEADSLDYIKLPTTIQTIERGAFLGRKGLKKILFPTSLQTIGDFAFQNCTGLEEARIPSTLLSIGDYAFDGCDNMEKVYTYIIEPVSIDQNTFSCWHNADLYVPTTSYYTYYYNTQWSQFLHVKEFDEEYTYFYLNNDYELDDNTGAVDGQPDVDLNPGSGLIVSGDSIEQNTGTVVVGSDDENGTASIIACDNNLFIDSLVVRLLARKNHWCYFCFPFDVPLSSLSFRYQFVIREYNGAVRAQYGSGGWQSFQGDTLRKGMGYIFQGAKTDTLVISIQNPLITCADYAHTIFAYSSGNSINSNWNFIGNPFPSWFDLEDLFNWGYTSPIYIWNGDDYKVYTPGDDEYHFHPFEGFFTQNPQTGNWSIVWESEGRETKTQTQNKQNGNHMPARKMARKARQAAAHRQLIDINLVSDEYSERARIVFNEGASAEYELGKDAVFMDGGGAPLHIWSIDGQNNRLSINERPYATGQVSLGYYVREDGFYTLSASRMDTTVIIYDNELEQEVDLSQGDYMFQSGAGTNTTRFAIVGAKQQPTDIDNTAGIDTDEPVNVYTILGHKILENVRRSDIHLGTGVYIVETKHGARTEMTIQ